MLIGEVDRHQCKRFKKRKGSPNQDTLRQTITNMANHIRQMAAIRADSPSRFYPKTIAELNNLRNTMSHKQYVTLYNKSRPYEAFPHLLGGTAVPRTLSGFGIRMKTCNRGILKSRQNQYEEKVIPVDNNTSPTAYRKIEVFVPCLSINKATIQPNESQEGEEADRYHSHERSRSSLSKKALGEYIPGTMNHRLSHMKNKMNYPPTYRLTNATSFFKDPETNRYIHEIRRPATSMSSRQYESNSISKEYEIPKSQKPDNRFKLPGHPEEGTKKVTFNEITETQVTRIETYYVSEKGDKYPIPKKEEPAPLTVRNLEIHQALLKPLSQRAQQVDNNLELITEVNRKRIVSWITERVREIPEYTLRHAEEEMTESRKHPYSDKPLEGEDSEKLCDTQQGLFQVENNEIENGTADNPRDVKNERINLKKEAVVETAPETPRYRLLKNMLTMSEFTCERIGGAEDLSSLATIELGLAAER